MNAADLEWKPLKQHCSLDRTQLYQFLEHPLLPADPSLHSHSAVAENLVQWV